MTFKRKDMPREFYRTAICDCNNGHYICSVSQLEIDFIYQVMIKSAVETGDWISSEIKDNAINVISEIKDYMSSRSSSPPSPFQ
jgi:hypothetical protein